MNASGFRKMGGAIRYQNKPGSEISRNMAIQQFQVAIHNCQGIRHRTLEASYITEILIKVIVRLP